MEPPLVPSYVELSTSVYAGALVGSNMDFVAVSSEVARCFSPQVCSEFAPAITDTG